MVVDEGTEGTALDRALRECAGNLTCESGDVIVSWVAVAGIRDADGGGYVLSLASQDMPPIWQIRGMLADALANIDRQLMRASIAPDDE